MYLKKMFMDEQGSLSYLIGCTGAKKACVVDPKKGVKEYIDTARKFGLEITHIFDTRHESGSQNGNMELLLRTGALIYYLNRESGHINHSMVKEGDTFALGCARIEIINSPRHNPFGKSILVEDMGDVNAPWMVLNRESLFLGDLRFAGLCGNELVDKVDEFIDDQSLNSEKSAHNISKPSYQYFPNFGTCEYAAPSMA